MIRDFVILIVGLFGTGALLVATGWPGLLAAGWLLYWVTVRSGWWSG